MYILLEQYVHLTVFYRVLGKFRLDERGGVSKSLEILRDPNPNGY